jgi:hypothetical protein
LSEEIVFENQHAENRRSPGTPSLPDVFARRALRSIDFDKWMIQVARVDGQGGRSLLKPKTL